MIFNKDKFHLGTYVLKPYARSEKHIKELKECGIDLVISVNQDKEMLDLFTKYNIGAIVNDVFPKWWGGDGNNAGTLSQVNPVEKYVEALNSISNHPAIVGIDLGDEPAAIDFAHYGKIVEALNKINKDKFLYLNIYPNYGYIATNTNEEVVKQLSTNTYQEYIDEYLRCLDLDYISYDHYLYSSGIALAYENLRIVSEASLKTNKPVMIVLQVNSHLQDTWISENMLRFQSYSALCFGARTITWGCYTAGWWYNEVLDENGNKTEQYDKLKTINNELLTFVDEYMKYKYISTHFLAFAKNDEDLKNVNIKPINELTISNVVDLHVANGKKVIAGYFVNKENNNDGLMLCAADDPYDLNNDVTKIIFKTSANKVLLHQDGYTKTLTPINEYYEIDLNSNHGAFIEIII